MAYKWPFKDPDEQLNYSVDWSRFLGADTIQSVQWYINDSDGTKTAIDIAETVNTITLENKSNTDTVATAIFSGGTANTSYKVTCAITFGDSSLVAERKIILPVKER